MNTPAHPTHVILGAHGAVGRALSPLLRAAGVSLRQVARTPRAAGGPDDLFVADLLDAKQHAASVAGAHTAYLLAGLPYDTAVWQRDWPRLMQHAIDACAQHGTRLVFFDNVYAYGRVDGVMTEATPFNPCSRKGEVRARVAEQMLDAMRRGVIVGMIVRSADFYYHGAAGATNSMLNQVVIDRMRAGKTPQWLGSVDVPYSATWVPDIARSMAHLVTRDHGWGQTWHALTSSQSVTARALIDLACRLAEQPTRVQTASRALVRVLSLFDRRLREQIEMLYQYEAPYRFDSTKLTAASDLVATPYEEGLATAWAAR
jgi:nucleoside-diphosphate-sugar epimerase